MSDIIKTIKELLNLLGDGFHRTGGTSNTSWDECGECGNPDWRGHKPDCKMKIGIERAMKLLNSPLIHIADLIESAEK